MRCILLISLTVEQNQPVGSALTLSHRKPTGVGYMEDFHKAGGIAPVLRGLRELNLLHLDCVTVSGMTLGEQIDSMPLPPPFPQSQIIRPISDPVFEGGSIAVLRGNLCDSAIVKQSASTIKSLLQHKGRAVVFEGLADMAERLDSEDLVRSALLIAAHISIYIYIRVCNCSIASSLQVASRVYRTPVVLCVSN